MMTQDKFSNLSNDELLDLLEKYNKDFEEVLQEIFKRQDAGRMEEFMDAEEFTKQYSNAIKKAS